MPIDLNGNILSSTSITGSVFSNTIITDGLVCYLDAGNKNSYGTSGTSWLDLSPNGNNGTLVNGVGYTSDTGGGLAFNGSNQYVTITHTPFNLNTSTIIYVAKLDSSPNSRNTVFSQYYGGNGAQFEIDNTGGIRSGFRQNAAGTPENDPGSNGSKASTTTYFHIAVTHNTSDSSRTKHFLNGNIIGVSTNSSQTDINSNDALNIGRNSAAGLYFKGNVYLFMIYNRILNNAEILSNYYSIKSRFSI
jgi:hypothetical protein